MSTTAYLALGSNLGDRAVTLARAIMALDDIPGTRVTDTAGVYETRPVGGPPGQGDFLNTACAVETDLAPQPFLAEIHRIERNLGRRREEEERWGPRHIDIDIIFWGDMLLDGPELTIPHPRMHERGFVLRPLADIAPDFRHPILGSSVRELLDLLERKNRLP